MRHAPELPWPSSGPSFDTTKTALCVLETRENIAASRVIFYDESLRELGDLRLPYAGLGQYAQLPVIHEGALFVIPGGYEGKRNERKVLEIDLSTLNVKAHTIDRVGMYGVAADDDYVYACSNLNGYSYIDRCTRSDGEVIEAKEEGLYVMSIILCEDRLCAFAEDILKSKPWLLVYDLNLASVSRVDLSPCGRDQCRPLSWEGKVYFPSELGTKGDDDNSEMLGVYDVGTGTLEAIPLGMAIQEVIPWGGRLAAFFGDMHDSANGKTTPVALCDPSDGWSRGDAA